MSEKPVFINRWLYHKPDLVPNKEGNIVLISKKSFGPLEIFEMGIDSNNIPYECYEWLENDWFEDFSYRKNITNQDLINVINLELKIFNDNGLSEWSCIINGVIDRLNSADTER